MSWFLRALFLSDQVILSGPMALRTISASMRALGSIGAQHLSFKFTPIRCNNRAKREEGPLLPLGSRVVELWYASCDGKYPELLPIFYLCFSGYGHERRKGKICVWLYLAKVLLTSCPAILVNRREGQSLCSHYVLEEILRDTVSWKKKKKVMRQ